jgi:hypothetical protein
MFRLVFSRGFHGPDSRILADFAFMQNAVDAETDSSSSTPDALSQSQPPQRPAPLTPPRPREIGGPPGPEPTRYGDWEKKGRCIDF